MAVNSGELLRSSIRIAFDKKAPITNFLTNFFAPEELTTSKVTLHGKAVKAIYSVDVRPGTDGNRFECENFHEKEYIIPEYNDYDTISAADLEIQQFGESKYAEMIASVSSKIAEKQITASGMQRLAEEKQAADAFFQGKIVLKNADEIVFDKPASHTIDKSAKKWNTESGDPIEDIGNACDLVKSDALIAGGEFHCIMNGVTAAALIKSPKLKANSNWNNGLTLNDIHFPEEKTGGANFFGQITTNGKIVNIWGYDGQYTIPKGFANAGKTVGFIPAGGVLILPAKNTLKRYYGANSAVPENGYSNILTDAVGLVKGQQYYYQYAVLSRGNCYVEAGSKSRPLIVLSDPNEVVTLHNVL